MSETSRTTTTERKADSLDIEDLFATKETELSLGGDDRSTTSGTVTPGTGTVTPGPEDTTAGELFQQLQDEHESAQDGLNDDPGDIAEESPEEIIARADEETEHVDDIDDSIRAEAGALDDLLLTERREAHGFLWVETNDDATTATESTEAPSLDPREDGLFGTDTMESTASSASTPEWETKGTGSSTTGTGSSTTGTGYSTTGTGTSTTGTGSSTTGTGTSTTGTGSSMTQVDDDSNAVFSTTGSASGDDTDGPTTSDRGTPGGATKAAQRTHDDDTSEEFDLELDESTTGGERASAESTGRTDSKDPRAAATEDDDDGGEEDGGLASRIRSILSG